jgi:hypothetical protein
MATHAVNVTDFSRGLSEYLNNVQYKGMVLDIERGKRIVARVSPAGQADGFPIGQLDDLLGKGPQLSAADRHAMVTDVRAVRAQLRTKADPWA